MKSIYYLNYIKNIYLSKFINFNSYILNSYLKNDLKFCFKYMANIPKKLYLLKNEKFKDHILYSFLNLFLVFGKKPDKIVLKKLGIFFFLNFNYNFNFKNFFNFWLIWLNYLFLLNINYYYFDFKIWTLLIFYKIKTFKENLSYLLFKKLISSEDILDERTFHKLQIYSLNNKYFYWNLNILSLFYFPLRSFNLDKK